MDIKDCKGVRYKKEEEECLYKVEERESRIVLKRGYRSNYLEL